jgi:HlyD family secretion protein
MLKGFFKKRKKLLIVILVIAIIAIPVTITVNNKLASDKAKKAATDITRKAVNGNIKVEISGDGVIAPFERYDINPLVKGKILLAPFEEGQKVKKGDLLYKIDATDLEATIQKSKNSIEKLQVTNQDNEKNLNRTIIYAEASGRLMNFNVKADEPVTTAKVGEILNDSYSIAKIPFNKEQIKQITVGQSASITSESLMFSIEGKVSKVYQNYTTEEDGAILYDVEIMIPAPNGFAKDSKVVATIGDMESPKSGKIQLPDTYSVTSALSGRVKKVYVSNNDYVQAGQKLFELDNDSYVTALNKGRLELDDAMISLKSYEKQLEDYNITAPIDGIIMTKNYKEGDTIYTGSSAVTLAVVSNMDKVKFSMKIDELDISKMKLGQAVAVSADALPNSKYVGEITSIAGEGTAANGVSNYLVQVTIKEPGELKSGMNVTAKTIVAEKSNVLIVPAGAVQKTEGKYYVTLPADSSGNKKTTEVTVGINNKDYIEIASGLVEGQEIVLPANAEESTKATNKMNGGSGGQRGF